MSGGFILLPKRFLIPGFKFFILFGGLGLSLHVFASGKCEGIEDSVLFRDFCQEQESTVVSGTYYLRLDEAVYLAHQRSIEAMIAKYNFFSSYWEYRSYKASRLPSLNIGGKLAGLDRSLRLLQDYNGELGFVENFSLENTLEISVRQNIGFTGGTLELYSSLTRLDQFVPDKACSYYSQPVTLAYTQPIFAFNSFKWEKKVAPKEYEKAQVVYAESMESVTVKVVSLYYELLESYESYQMARQNCKTTKASLDLAHQRLTLGTMGRDEVLQLEFRLLNDSMTENQLALDFHEKQTQLGSFLRYGENVLLLPVLEDSVPELWLDYQLLCEKAMENSSFSKQKAISVIEADAEVAKAKAERGATASIYGRFGVSGTADAFSKVYTDLLDQEVIGIQFSVPIFDWGMGRGKVRMAKARRDVVSSQLEQSETVYRQEVLTLVKRLQYQYGQCLIARKAREVARQRYAASLERFRQGNISVLELNTAQGENASAHYQYVTILGTFWSNYYQLRQKTLYDCLSKTDIVVELNRLVEEAEGRR